MFYTVYIKKQMIVQSGHILEADIGERFKLMQMTFKDINKMHIS